MRLVSSSAVAPLIAGCPIAIVTFLAMHASETAFLMLVVMVIGMPVAVLLSILATYFLQSDELFQARYSLLYCAMLGAFLAAVATLGMLGLSVIFWGVVAWGFLSGGVFRLLLGCKRIRRT